MLYALPHATSHAETLLTFHAKVLLTLYARTPIILNFVRPCVGAHTELPANIFDNRTCFII